MEAVLSWRKAKRESKKRKIQKQDIKLGGKKRAREEEEKLNPGGNERGRQEEGRECSWEWEGMRRRDTKREMGGGWEREWSILEPWVTHGNHKASSERLATGCSLLTLQSWIRQWEDGALSSHLTFHIFYRCRLYRERFIAALLNIVKDLVFCIKLC